MILLLSGVIFTLFASTRKTKLKLDIEYDDLAPGLNIDLDYYLTDVQVDANKKKKKRKEELLSLLG